MSPCADTYLHLERKRRLWEGLERLAGSPAWIRFWKCGDTCGIIRTFLQSAHWEEGMPPFVLHTQNYTGHVQGWHPSHPGGWAGLEPGRCDS